MVSMGVYQLWLIVLIFSLFTHPAVTAPAQQRSQVISRSEHPRARSPRCSYFLKKVDDLFSRRPQNTKAANAAETVLLIKIKQIKRSADRYGKFLFSVHTITEAKQSNRQGGARAMV